ncbi:MAG: ABC transporter ATP-binding protein [Candidatus Heimdallarchaeota archaeon]|nr:MAG: ABC transporter ATP-binding protein [Candidatus Heimdallarchaeota archaeon]
MKVIDQAENPVVKLTNVSKVYGFINAVRNVELTIKEGETVGFLGNNGAGKSTLLKIIALLIKPTNGKIELFGNDVEENQHSFKRDIGTLLSHSFFYEDMTGRENLEFYLKMNRKVNDYTKVIDKAVERYNLKFFIDRPIHELSTGMAKKLELLRVALPNLPRLVLLDEPFSGLDVENKQFIKQIIAERESNTTVIICSHDFDSISLICTKVFYLEKGRIERILEPSEYDYFLKRQN